MPDDTEHISIPAIEYHLPSELKTDGQNPNKMNLRQLDALHTCIKQYGFIVPIITNRDLLIADGEQRWAVAKSLGMERVPVIRLDVKDADRRLLRQVLNKLRGEHVYSLNVEEYSKIIEADGKKDLLHLLQESDDHLARYLRLVDDPASLEKPPPNLSEIPRGTIIHFGENTLTCADAFTTRFTEESALVFMDPPWDLPIPDKFIQQFIDDNATIIILHNDKTVALIAQTFKKYFHYFLVFTRSTATITVKSMPLIHHTLACVLGKKPKFNKLTPSVTTVFTDYSSPFKHDKNPLVTKTIIEAYADEGDTVLEPFANKPTMLFVCEQTNRIYHGVEIDGKKCASFKWLWENKHLEQAHAMSSTAPVPTPKSPQASLP